LPGFAKLKDLEERALEDLQRYKEYEAETKRLKEIIEIKTSEINNLVTRINYENYKKDEVSEIINERLPDELSSKLATIPESIVLVGRIRTRPNVKNKTILDKLDRKMQDYAINQIAGTRYQNYIRQVDGGVPKYLEERKTVGKAEIADSYYKDFLIIPEDLPDGEAQRYFYKILRIEVFPDDGETVPISEKRDELPDELFDENIQIYEIDTSLNTLNEVASLEETQFSIHKFRRPGKRIHQSPNTIIRIAQL
jgi:hypothetical protein